jgi:hypothetical protein
MKAYAYDDDGYYIGERDCQLDPLETEQQGKEVYLLPANATFSAPLDPQEGCKIKYVGKAWQYEAIPVEEEPVEPEPTEKELIEREISDLKDQLAESDYKTLKYVEGQIDEKEFEEIKAERQALRDKIGELEEKLTTLE